VQYPQIGLARIEIAEEGWRRLEAGGKPQGQAFTPSGGERRVAVITTNGNRTSLAAGIDNLLLLRSGGLAARGGEDVRADGAPLLIAALDARWAYTSGEIAFGPYRQGVRNAIVETFAWHARGSVQEMLAAMSEVVLASYEEISSVTLTFQERPYRPVDLLDLSVESDALFLVHDEPLGVVEITVER
jgi:urate oxidase